MEALARLHLTVTRAYKVNPDINFEIFIHKVDGLSDDHKIETQRDIHQRANDDLADAGLEKIHLRWEKLLFRECWRGEQLIWWVTIFCPLEVAGNMLLIYEEKG